MKTDPSISHREDCISMVEPFTIAIAVISILGGLASTTIIARFIKDITPHIIEWFKCFGRKHITLNRGDRVFDAFSYYLHSLDLDKDGWQTIPISDKTIMVPGCWTFGEVLLSNGTSFVIHTIGSDRVSSKSPVIGYAIYYKKWRECKVFLRVSLRETLKDEEIEMLLGHAKTA